MKVLIQIEVTTPKTKQAMTRLVAFRRMGKILGAKFTSMGEQGDRMVSFDSVDPHGRHITGKIEEAYEVSDEENQQVISRMCTCGHAQKDHNPRQVAEKVLAKGHGSCQHINCPCKRFTWRASK